MSYRITVADTDISFECAPDTSILDAAKQAGYEIPYSCRNGICGSCKGKVVSGEYRAAQAQHGLSAQELAEGHALFCQARPESDLDISVRTIARIDPDATRQLEAKLHKVTRLRDDVSVLQLRFPAGVRVPFQAGQYLQVVLEDGSRRSYSMANPSHQSDGVHLHVRHVPDGRFTEYLERMATAGDVLTLELPFGDFFLRPSDRPLIFVASGTGFAPIKSILEGMFKQGNPRQPVYLYWGGRRKADLYMSELPEKWMGRYSNFHFIPVVSDEATGADRTGFVHAAVLDDFPSLKNYQVYACGAPAMINAARNDFIQERGLPSDAFYCDAFVTTRDSEPAAADS